MTQEILEKALHRMFALYKHRMGSLDKTLLSFEELLIQEKISNKLEETEPFAVEKYFKITKEE